LIVGYCRTAGYAPRVAQEAVQTPTIVSLVAAGMGVALVPASLRHMRRTGVVYRAMAERSPLMEVGLAWRESDEEPAVTALVAHARAAFRTTAH
jgi:DNA-binding transcriptional LysR family regulator